MKKEYKVDEDVKNKTLDEIKSKLNLSGYENNKVFLKDFFKYGKLESSKDYISTDLKDDEEFIIGLIEEVLKKERKGSATEFEVDTRYDILIRELGKPKNYFNDYYGEILKIYKKYNSFFNYFDFSLKKMEVLSEAAESFKHNTLKGEARETFAKEFLELILPSNIEYAGGEIVEVSGRKSNQLDLILQDKKAPRLKITNDSILAFYQYVLAVIEIKTTLTDGELETCLNQSKLLKNMHLRDSSFITKNHDYIELKDDSAKILGIPHIIFAYKSACDILKIVKSFIKNNTSTTLSDIYRVKKEDFLSDMIVLIDKNECWKKTINKTTNEIKFEKIESDNVLIELFLFLNHIFNKKADTFNNNIRYLPVYFGKDKLP